MHIAMGTPKTVHPRWLYTVRFGDAAARLDRRLCGSFHSRCAWSDLKPGGLALSLSVEERTDKVVGNIVGLRYRL